MIHERKTTNELYDALETLIHSNKVDRDLIRELQVHQVELEIQNRELRLAQQQLAQSRRRYADLYDFSPVGYASLDENGTIEEINIAGGKLLGDNPHKLVGRSFFGFIVPEDASILTDHLKRCRHTRRQ